MLKQGAHSQLELRSDSLEICEVLSWVNWHALGPAETSKHFSSTLASDLSRRPQLTSSKTQAMLA